MPQSLSFRPDNIRIAVTDDHSLIRDGLISVINSFENCIVNIEAENGKQLLNKLSSCVLLPEVCFIDIGMPVMNGYDTIPAIKRQWPALKIIVVSMFDEEFAVVNMFNLGANSYLLKNSNPKEFKKAIFEVLHDRNYLCSTLPGDWIKNPNHKLILSDRELQFLISCGNDMSYTDIATEWNASVRTVEKVASRVSEKLNIHGRTGFALFANRTGLISRKLK
jgi:DNA-binding NarL/FixJ family response regulator